MAQKLWKSLQKCLQYMSAQNANVDYPIATPRSLVAAFFTLLQISCFKILEKMLKLKINLFNKRKRHANVCQLSFEAQFVFVK